MTPAISARFATSADTTWRSAMTFLDLVEIEVDYRRYAHDVSAVRRHFVGVFFNLGANCGKGRT
jgi:hypothetical protein